MFGWKDVVSSVALGVAILYGTWYNKGHPCGERENYPMRQTTHSMEAAEVNYMLRGTLDEVHDARVLVFKIMTTPSLLHKSSIRQLLHSCFRTLCA